ncbi:MAG: PIG-L deacetylase family protein [bacterium]|nr:PIG-L deacetylase family protein [bacterium]
MNKILVVAAHPDDEVLGAGGTILKHIENGDQVNILLLGDGVSSRSVSAGKIKKRAEQARRAAQFLGAKKIILNAFPDNRFDSVPLLKIIKKIEKIVNEIKPKIIYTHFSDDLNIDHRLTFQAVMTVCRPQPEFFVKKIMAFEVLSSTEWQAKKKNKLFCPNQYNDIGKFIDKKIKAMEIYSDELKTYPHPRSKEGIKILAQYRGLEAGFKYAEAFSVVRILKD